MLVHSDVCCPLTLTQAQQGNHGMEKSQGWTITLCPLKNSSPWRNLEPCWKVGSSKVSLLSALFNILSVIIVVLLTVCKNKQRF